MNEDDVSPPEAISLSSVAPDLSARMRPQSVWLAYRMQTDPRLWKSLSQFSHLRTAKALVSLPTKHSYCPIHRLVRLTTQSFLPVFALRVKAFGQAFRATCAFETPSWPLSR